MTVSGIYDLAHGDSDKETPELLTAGGRGLSRGLAQEEAREHALENVLLIFSTKNPVVEVATNQEPKTGSEPFPDDPGRLFSQPDVGRSQVVNITRQRTYGTHKFPRRIGGRLVITAMVLDMIVIK
jgi:hypothetical protein